MRKLRVFISSTCYDLSSERKELYEFIENMGYEPVGSDFNDVLYDPNVHTHVSCVKSVEECDMLVLLVGGRFWGTAIPAALSVMDNQSGEDLSSCSITQLECRRAIEKGVYIYPFIKEDVVKDHGEYAKAIKEGIVLSKFESIQKQETAKYIFSFIDYIRRLPKGNAYYSFKTIDDVKNALKKQWSMMFAKCIRERKIVDTITLAANNGVETIKHNRDVAALEDLLSEIDLNALEFLAKQDPHYMDDAIVDVWEPIVRCGFCNPYYYDEQLNKFISSFSNHFFW